MTPVGTSPAICLSRLKSADLVYVLVRYVQCAGDCGRHQQGAHEPQGNVYPANLWAIVDHLYGQNLESSSTSLLVFGNGDGGGGPLAKMLESVRPYLLAF
jgi:hypothetical protein